MQPLIERTHAKLRYAKIILDEIKVIGILNGGDFDKAHQEAFLFHLAGAREAFLAELNFYYDAGLSADSISIGKLRKAIMDKGASSPEVAELYRKENEVGHWLYFVKNMRDISTHMLGVPRHYHLGGPNHQKVFLTKPNSTANIEVHFIEAFEEWLSNMESLLERMRASAQLQCPPLTHSS